MVAIITHVTSLQNNSAQGPGPRLAALHLCAHNAGVDMYARELKTLNKNPRRKG